ncbi:S-layer homology domain-containing protein [Leucobacter coleopterorum]|uniref:S-layer homology domain-containing protein n=2 Tax=Leucobacter coleopterorum TaxID=2714933 RepID=A0ABX6JZB4_9MICO|nr:S-layer homology domain-containing protein [Leucobacter coleopterorum]
MGYACTPICPRALQFSNPRIPLIGFPSIPSGVTNKQDNVRSMDEQASRIASYRQSAIATDVPKTHRFYTEITWLVNRGITTGYADGTFRPSEDLDRGAMAAFLYRMSGKPAFTPPATSPFTDVPKTHKFYKEITWMKAKGITSGYADGTFKPLDNVSRSAMSAFLYRFNGKPAFTPPSTSPFSDVPKTHQFYKEITWMKAKGISTGNADGTFAPSSAVTREAMAAFLYRYDQKLG